MSVLYKQINKCMNRQTSRAPYIKKIYDGIALLTTQEKEKWNEMEHSIPELIK